MRSATSYFNTPLYQKNLARFWPIWAGYTLLWMFILPFPFFSILSRYGGDVERQSEAFLSRANELHYTLQGGTAISVGFGLAAAMAVFSYLFFSRSSCMMHSLPLDRKGLFWTNYLSGLSFLLLPHLAIFLITAAVEGLYHCLNLPVLWQWFWVQSATALFFYSFAVFCAMFTGNIMAMPAFYGILNGLAASVYYLLDSVLDEFLYGYMNLGRYWDTIVLWLTPSVKLIDACDPYQNIYSDELGGYTSVLSTHIHGSNTVLIYGAVGLVLALLALWIYQTRHVESAGDVVAIPIVRPIFKIGVAICSGMAFGIFTSALLGVYDNASTTMIFLITLWTAIGAFVAEMLLKKSFRVLHSWKSALILSMGMCLVFTGLKLDWLGFETNIPDSLDVSSISLANTSGGAPYDDAHYGSSVVIDDEQRIKHIIALHQAILKEKDRQSTPGNDYYTIRMEYSLKNGATLSRYYNSLPVFEGEIQAVGSVTRNVHMLLQDRELVRRMYRFDAITPEWHLSEAYVDGNYWSDKYSQTVGERFYLDQAASADLEQLWKAVQTDFDEGTIGVRYLFDQSEERLNHTYTSDLTFVFRKPVDTGNDSLYAERTFVDYAEPMSVAVQEAPGFRNKYFSITLTPDAKHTLACLEELGGPTPDNGLITHAQMRQLEEASNS